MPSLTEEILVTLQGRDNASQVVNNFASNAQSSLNGISSGASDIGGAYSSTFDTIGQGVHTLNSGMISLSSLNRTIMSELGSTKSAMDWVYGTTSKEDTNKVLVGNMTKTQEEYDSLYNTIDKVTDNSLTSMQELIPALNAFRSATQATAGQLENDVTQDMAQFGAFVLAQTGSTQLALTAMMDLSKGIKGRYASLDQYGISAEALKATGLWKEAEGGSKTKNWTGDEKDIKGYMDAVVDVIGSTDELMNTNEGLNAQMGKMWSRAGKRIGHEMMPGLKSLKQMFIDLDTEMNGDLSTGVLRVALGIEEMQQKAYTLNTFYDAFRNLSNIATGVARYFGIGTSAIETSTMFTQENSDAIAQNTDMLLANTDARLANADASMIMGDAAMMGEAGMMGTGAGATNKQLAAELGGYAGVDMASGLAMNKFFGADKSYNPNDFNIHSAKGLQNLNDATNKSKQLMPTNIYGTDVFQKINDVKDYTGMPKNIYDTDTIKKINDYNNGKLDKAVFDGRPFARFKQRVNFLARDIREFSPGNTLRSAGTRMGGGLQSGLKGLFTSIGNIPSFIKGGALTSFGKISNAFSSFGTRLDTIFGRGLTTNLDNAYQGMRSGFGKLGGIFSRNKAATKVVEEGVEETMKSGAKVAGAAGEAGVIGGEMSAATGGLSFMGLAEMGLAGAFQALLIPTLAVAGVIAVMIPIVAGLAIEALFFINLVGQFMTALNFDNIDTESAVEGLQDIATGLAWLGVAMASLTFVGFTGMMGMAVASLLSLVGGIPALVELITTIGAELEPLNSLDINTDSVENLQRVGEILNNMSLVMLSLSGLQLSVGLSTVLDGFGLFSRVFGDAIDRAKTDISRAIDAINSINFGSIDANKAEQVKTVMEAIKSFSDAFSGLTKIRADNAISDFVTWLLDGGLLGNGGKSISEAFELAKNDITEASKAISNFTNLTDIDQTTVDRLTKVGDSIKAMGDAFEGLRKIRDDSNWDAMFDEGGMFEMFKGKHDIASALDQSKETMVRISKSLKGLNGRLADIPDNVAKRLQKVADTITSVTTILDNLSKLKEATGKKNKNLDSYVDVIKATRQSLIKVSKQLKALDGENGLASIPDGVATKLKGVTTTLEDISKSVEGLKTISDNTSKGKDMSSYAEMIESARTNLVSISKKLKALDKGEKDGGLADITNSNINGKLQAVVTILSSISKAVEQLGTISSGSNGGANFDQYATMIDNARIGLNKISTSLQAMGDGKGKDDVLTIDPGLPGKIDTVTSVLVNIAKAFENLKTLNETNGSAQADGFTKYRQVIWNAKTGLNKISTTLKDMKIEDIDQGKVAQIKNVTTTLQSVSDAMSEMKNIFDEFGGNEGDGDNTANVSTSSLVFKGDTTNNANTNKGTVSNIENYKKSVQDSITAVQEIAAIIKPLNKDKNLQGIGELKGKINTFKGALSALSSSTNVMQNFPQIDGHNAGFKVARAVTGLKRASTEMKKLNQNDKVGEGIKGVIQDIKSSLNKLKDAVKATDVKPASEDVGGNIVKGIGTGMSNLSSTVSGKIQAGTRGAASSGWTMGATIAESVNRAFSSSLRLTEIVNQAVQNASTSATGSPVTNGASTAQSDAESSGGTLSDVADIITNPIGALTDNGEGMRGVYRNTRNLLNGLNGNYNQLNLNRFNSNRRAGLTQMNSNSQIGKNSKSVNINIGEGAVQVATNGLTKKESRQVMINALEGLSMIKSVQTK